MFEAFRESDYRRFWTAQFISNIGSWMQSVAQGWLVYRLTDSAFLLGFVGFANAAPSIFLMLPGGVLADQLDRRKVLRASQWAQSLAALGLAIAIRADVIHVWHIIAAAVVTGTAMSFSAPAYQAMIVDLLDDRKRLPNAVAMNSLQFNLSRAIGPVIAGATLAAYGSFWCFLANAFSFLPLIWLLGRLKNRQQPSNATMSELWTRLGDGFRYVLADRAVLIFLSISAAASLFGYPYTTLMPVVARSLFTNDATGLGYLMAAIGVGALGGALSISISTPRPRTAAPIIVTCLTLFGVAIAAVGLVRSVPLVLALLVVCGATMVVAMALCNTSIQQRLADDMRGRVLSMYTFSFFAFFPVGNLLTGSVAEKRGVTVAMLVLGAALVACAVIAAIALRALRGRAASSPT